MVTPFLALLVACADPPAGDTGVAPMPVAALAVRTSLDLRGVRPTVEELAAIEADPDAFPGIIDAWMQDARFGARVRDLWSEVYRTRAAPRFLSAASYGLDDPAAFTRSVGEEPLRILERVAVEDRPWTDLATADWTMADPLLAGIWPITREAGEGWQPARYTDSRPAAGILATNSFHWRYDSTASNANRKRANAASRVLLCQDYLVRPIDFDRNVNLLDESAVESALVTDPGCVNCHQALDPLASFFFGFSWLDPSSVQEASRYHPERERDWRARTGRAPEFHGRPGYGLADLGQAIAGDPKFATCAVEQAWSLLLRRPVEQADTDALVLHREAFLAGDLRLRPLLASIVKDPRYRAGASDAAGAVSRKMVTADLLASSIEGLTGFRWAASGYDLLADDTVGYRTLAGGADGYAVTANATEPNATLVLVQSRLAEAAAAWMVTNEPARLLPGVELSYGPDDDAVAFAGAVQHLHLALYGTHVAADGPEVQGAADLWRSLRAVETSGAAAWTGLVTALLRDPMILFY